MLTNDFLEMALRGITSPELGFIFRALDSRYLAVAESACNTVRERVAGYADHLARGLHAIMESRGKIAERSIGPAHPQIDAGTLLDGLVLLWLADHSGKKEAQENNAETPMYLRVSFAIRSEAQRRYDALVADPDATLD